MSLLVVDSLSFVVAPMLGSTEVDGHALMICLGRSIKQLAQRHSIVALTTNHLVGGAASHRSPVKGWQMPCIGCSYLLVSRMYIPG